MKDFTKISALMKEDWDRRVRHDYRFWMSDGHESDQAMWESGARDFGLMTRGLPDGQTKTIVDLGCGVGRLLKAALQSFGRVIGVDVSETALKKAKELLGQDPRLSLICGNGVDLHQISDASVDTVVSFAALTSVPLSATASYLLEVNRILKPGGVFRLQFYLGREQPVCATDTLHLRSYERDNFARAAQAAGFNIEFIEELVLPFQVSFKEIGFEAVIISLHRESDAHCNAQELAEILRPGGEIAEGQDGCAEKDLECWMALNYAEQLAQQGETEKARETLEYVENFCRSATIDTADILARIVARIEDSRAASLGGTGEYLEKNLRILEKRFPAAYRKALVCKERDESLEVIVTAEGPALFVNGQCLDHPQKPQSAARTWAEKLLKEDRFNDAESVLIYGFGAGYHVEALLRSTYRRISVVEPSLPVFMAAMRERDLESCLSGIEHLALGQEDSSVVFHERSELAVRPQSQAAFPDYCARLKSDFFGRRGFATLHPKIAVLGPMQGGTLPIAGYCIRALEEMEQRRRLYDMSGFAQGYSLFDQFIFDKLRQLNSHGQYIEALSQLLLDSMAEKPVDILLCMPFAPISVRALKELKERGVITVFWFVEDYARFTFWQQLAPLFDYVFCIQKGAAMEAIKAAGAGEVHYLPAACDPGIHRPVSLSPEEIQRWGSAVSFVGAGYHNRQQTFASLASLPFRIWGTEWPECRPFDRLVQERGRRLSPEEYVKIFSASEINLNLHSSTERDGVDPNGDFLNPRLFELAASGAFQLVDQRSLLPEVFAPGKEVVVFRDKFELKEQIDYYLAHPEERKQIAQRARERALREHTYAQRIKQMLSVIYCSRYEELKRKEDQSPWGRMLKRSASDPELNQRCREAFKRGEEPSLDGLVSGIVTGQGKLTQTELKLLFLFHVKKQIIRMTQEEAGLK